MLLFDEVSALCSKMTTEKYSTSFTLGIKMLDEKFHQPIYSIYGFVRFADEIVDSFHSFNREKLLAKFEADTWVAIEEGISLNPIINSFQKVVNTYKIDREFIEIFFNSMKMDLQPQQYDHHKYSEYILGSAEVVGLMCLRVFCQGDKQKFDELKYPAMKLGSAFQKINFLRDIKADHKELGRSYFPGVDINLFDATDKKMIEADIQRDFKEGLEGIWQLPQGARLGVYVAYKYYYSLFKKIRKVNAERVMQERIRIPDSQKVAVFARAFVRYNLNIL